MKIKRFLALIFAIIMCLCFSACEEAPEIVLDSNGRVTLESAQALAQYVVDEHCKVNEYGEYKYYKSTPAQGYPELVFCDDDWILSFKKAEGKSENTDDDIVVYVSRNGEDVQLIGIPGENPLEESAE